jgi:phosphate uptake regulator
MSLKVTNARRKQRVRISLRRSANGRPRLSVFRSSKHIYAQVIDDLKEKLRVHHILRLQQGACSIETGFVWSDLLTALERIGDHCSNIAGCIVDMAHHDMNMHEALRSARVENEHFTEQYKDYAAKYSLKR